MIGLIGVIVAAAIVTLSPTVVFDHITWIIADPVRVVLVTTGLAIVRPLLAWPTTFLAVLIGYGIGLGGLPLALGLITFTSIPPYLLGRQYDRATSHSKVGAEFIERTGDTRSVVATRLIPAPSDVVSVGAGIAGVSLIPFILGTIIGELPWAIAGVLAGASAETLTTLSLRTLIQPQLIAAGSIIAVILIGPPVWAWIRERRWELNY
jgi:uncharacterized membrane protein YdjX (TVP38/TMEM64 family)